MKVRPIRPFLHAFFGIVFIVAFLSPALGQSLEDMHLGFEVMKWNGGKAKDKGAGAKGFDFSSGWYCTPTTGSNMLF